MATGQKKITGQEKIITTKDIGKKLDDYKGGKTDHLPYFYLNVRIKGTDNHCDPLTELGDMEGDWKEVTDWPGLYFGEFNKDKTARDTEETLYCDIAKDLKRELTKKLGQSSKAATDCRVPEVLVMFTRACRYTPEDMET